MALDYSKLSDQELEAIANDDYSKLSDSTLQMLANEPSGSTKSSMTTVEPSLAEPIATQAVAAAPRAVATTAQSLFGSPAAGNTREMLNVAKNATAWTPNAMMEVISHPLQTAKAYVAGHPWADVPVSQLGKDIGKSAVGAVGRGVVSGLTAPENLLLAPYTMAGYEQEKIRANPNAPEYAKNPYAMGYRSQGGPAPMTQGQAGAMNQRNVVANMPYGNVTPEERAILDQDRIRKEQVQQRARQTLQQPPTAQNYIERMRALSTLYSPLNEQ